jgi:hypothetical protein
MLYKIFRRKQVSFSQYGTRWTVLCRSIKPGQKYIWMKQGISIGRTVNKSKAECLKVIEELKKEEKGYLYELRQE